MGEQGPFSLRNPNWKQMSTPANRLRKAFSSSISRQQPAFGNVFSLENWVSVSWAEYYTGQGEERRCKLETECFRRQDWLLKSFRGLCRINPITFCLPGPSWKSLDSLCHKPEQRGRLFLSTEQRFPNSHYLKESQGNLLKMQSPGALSWKFWFSSSDLSMSISIWASVLAGSSNSAGLRKGIG